MTLSSWLRLTCFVTWWLRSHVLLWQWPPPFLAVWDLCFPSAMDANKTQSKSVQAERYCPIIKSNKAQLTCRSGHSIRWISRLVWYYYYYHPSWSWVSSQHTTKHRMRISTPPPSYQRHHPSTNTPVSYSHMCLIDKLLPESPAVAVPVPVDHNWSGRGGENPSWCQFILWFLLSL